jgi:hypothetical protein
MPPAEARHPDSEPSLARTRAWSADRAATDRDTANPTCPICGAAIPLGQGVIRDDDARVHMECFDGVTRWAPSSPR